MVVPFWTPITPLTGSLLHADPQLLVFFNQGGGRFTRMTTTLPRGENGVLLTVADFDADGKQDLLYYQYGGSETEKLYFINVYRLDFKKP